MVFSGRSVRGSSAARKLVAGLMMRFNALVVAAVLLTVGGVVALAPVRAALGLGLDDSWQLSVIHASLAVAPLLFFPRRGGRLETLNSLCSALACWSAGVVVVLLFTFAARNEVGIGVHVLSFAAWFASAGLLAAAARGANWVFRARILLLCAFGLPPLWHYLALEYGGATATHLRPLSPNWQLAAHDIEFYPLLLLVALCWIAAFAIPERRANAQS
jgi:hypothetical protein